jgi:hypothetical protein
VIVALLILVPIAGASAWAFLCFSPPLDDRQSVTRFNWSSIAVAALLAAAWSVRTYIVMSPTVDSAWWPVISTLGALVIFPLVLTLAAVVRPVYLRHTGKEP